MRGKAKALAGWRRREGDHGIVLTIQLAGSTEEFRLGRFETLDVALNDRQLRSLARDLTRAAGERGIELFARRRWWQFWKGNEVPTVAPRRPGRRRRARSASDGEPAGRVS